MEKKKVFMVMLFNHRTKGVQTSAAQAAVRFLNLFFS